jgi:hypothetical protein
MPAKFKFGGHIRPFWVTDSTGRIRVTVTRTDLGTEAARSDIFYADGATVGQVADAVHQALFAAEGPTVEPSFSDRDRLSLSQLEARVKYLCNFLKGGRYETFGDVTYDKEVWVRPARAKKGNTGAGRRIPADQEAWEAHECGETIAAEQDRKRQEKTERLRKAYGSCETHAAEEAGREEPACSYPEDAISPGE